MKQAEVFAKMEKLGTFTMDNINSFLTWANKEQEVSSFILFMYFQDSSFLQNAGIDREVS